MACSRLITSIAFTAALLGETVSDTVRRLRLHRAAIDSARPGTEHRPYRRPGRLWESSSVHAPLFRVESAGLPPVIAGHDGLPDRTRKGIPAMYQVETVTLPRICASLRFGIRGNYQLTGPACRTVDGARYSYDGPVDARYALIGVFYDDPASVPEAELRSAACITVPEDWAPSAAHEAHIEGRRYARIVHTGPYTELKTAYDWLYQTWLPNSGEELRDLPVSRSDLNNPRQMPARTSRPP